MWFLAEYENGSFKLNRNPKQFQEDPAEWGSVEHYLRRQGRFKSLTDYEVRAVVEGRNATWERLRTLAGC